MGRHLDDYYVEAGRLVIVPGYIAENVAVGSLGLFDVHYDSVKNFDGQAYHHVTAAFVDRFAVPGVYALTDPIADNVVYVGRSAHIGRRFRQHIRTESSPRSGTVRREKREWMFTVLEEGHKPGLVVLSNLNTTEEELRLIQMLKPPFNTIVNGKPLSERQRREEEEQAKDQFSQANRVRIANICLRAVRKRKKGLPLTEEELRWVDMPDKTLEEMFPYRQRRGFPIYQR